MQEISSLFQRRSVDIPALLAYGFTRHSEHYCYTTHLLNGQFRMQVTVSAAGEVDTTLTDTASGDEYILHKISRTTGAFVGAVREAWQQVLEDIAGHCFPVSVFKTGQACQVVDYIRTRYHHELEFLWPRFPDNAIFRRSDNQKWYGALLTTRPASLGLAGEGPIEILDLRMDPDAVIQLTDNVHYFPGFHMNKKHWITIVLDGPVASGEIFSRIDDSYQLAARK
ncbi:MmcQ/YjbR family DNA-binding protein [Shimwellia blattae]|uniref:Cytoplasmic protein YjbR n=1 Tax=Shimwellia blattae (strain ATCC 29907 / DSM 4481 / JCM 1650 / NBRC 105725 / CDC 9005-74) TaxID=630626 RepID=I2B920_SHIBC|nr:MmcQ/YjbR family DNA-binding protein [Shimwellia blattae]AFJ47024.1 hypothetical protein EBL_c19320 [Shimwellia blattae DSM 4481 = NBRC 105725]GAB80853.1 hypothetical protein EB105725_10_00400 [Shimwellia blattae DSM 4481 = NBRC 105725]VDY64518.1 Uncharacterized protein conserved in bacteria [Shimwellia blattae]VEC22626.1 Uncharacterized protein conserved in bacteria [Shimwellia blattae]